MINEIAKAWGWTGMEPKEIMGENAFGNLLVKAKDGKYWRICPEDLSCEVVSQNDKEFDELRIDEDFLLDWEMERLLMQARTALGPLSGDQKYCLKLPAVLGGEYDADNMGTISFSELIRASGDIARQIADVPDGSKVVLKILD